MATTSNWLQNNDHARIGFVLAIEGTNLIYTTIADPDSAGADGIKAAWAGTDWAAVTWRGGLKVNGQMEQAIELFDPELKPDSLTFSLQSDEVGSDTNIAQTLLRMASSTAVWSPLAADIDVDDTTLTVKDGTNFATSGNIYIGNETIAHSGKSGNNLTGLTRGKFNIWETNGAVRWSTPHTINTLTNAAPIVSDTPTDSYNRGVALYLHHFEDGIWSTKSNAKLIWAGRIKSVTDEGNTFNVTAQNFMEVLARSTLMSEQFTGQVADGLWLTERLWRMRVIEKVNGVSNVDVEADLYSVAGRYQWNEVLSTINDALRSSGSLGTSLNYDWTTWTNFEGTNTIASQTTGIGVNVGFEFRVYLHPQVWGLLGFDSSGADIYRNSDSTMAGIRLSRDGIDSDNILINAPHQPVFSYPHTEVGATMEFDQVDGSFIAQSTFPEELGLAPAVEGFLQIGDEKVLAVKKSTDTKYVVHADVTGHFADRGLDVDSTAEPIHVIRRGDGLRKLQAKQLWWESDKTADVVLRTMLSTGTADFNHATYDKNPYEMGVGVPDSAIDTDSFIGLGDDKISLFLSEPTPFGPWLTSILATSGRYIVWVNGKLTVKRPRFDGQSLAASWTLNEGNTGGDPDDSPAESRATISYGAERLVNRFQLDYDQSISGKFRRKAFVQNVASITDYGQRNTIKHKGLALGSANVEPWIDNVASVGLGLFSRPITIFSRTYDQTLIEMRPLDTVSVNDKYMIDPVSGTRGVTSYPGWVLSTSFDWRTMRGDVTIAMLTDLDPSRIGAWAPTARVDEGAANAGYDVATTTLTCKANEYSHSSQGVDASFFAASEVVHIVELGPADGVAPLEWTRTIDTVTSNAIKVTSGLSSPAWDATKKYIIESTVISGAVAGQKADAYIADDADNSTGDAGNDAYSYGGFPDTVSDFTRTYIQRFRHMPTAADDTGSPLSVGKYHDLIQGLNNLLSYKTRNVSPQDVLVVDETVTGTTSTLVYGPIWVPIYSSGRNLLIRIRGHVSAGTGTFTVYAASQKLTGTADTTTTYPLNVVSGTYTTTSTTATWLTEGTLTPWVYDYDTPPGVFITVEANNSGANTTTLSGLSFCEDKI